MEKQIFEQSVDDIVRREIDGCTGLLACERLSAGASQQTYKLTIATKNGEALLAFRRGAPGMALDQGKPGLATEAALFRAAHAAGVPEPEVYYVLQDSDGLGDGFIMQWLDGETLGARIARHDDFAAIRPALARQCGEILARIHAIDVRACGLDQKLAHTTAEQLVRQTYNSYLALNVAQPMIDFTARWLLDNLSPKQADCLVHTDFRNGNLMVDPKDGIVAVLDWELAHIGDPVRDIGYICINSWRFGVSDMAVGGFGLLDDLLAGYKAVSGRDIDPAHIKFWQVFGSFWWATVTLGMGATFRQNLDRSVERPAIGRRSSEAQIDCVNLLIPGAVEAPLIHPPDTDTSGVPADELLDSVSQYLREEVMAKTKGRAGFLARVASNALETVRREATIGPANQHRQMRALENLLGQTGSLEHLRHCLSQRLHDGVISLDDAALHAFLRDSVTAQVMIDQPHYSGLATALRATDS